MHASLGGIELQAHSIHHLQTRIIWAIHKTWIRVSQKREQIDFIAIYNPRTRTNKCFVFIELFRRQLLKSQSSILFWRRSASFGEIRGTEISSVLHVNLDVEFGFGAQKWPKRGTDCPWCTSDGCWDWKMFAQPRVSLLLSCVSDRNSSTELRSFPTTTGYDGKANIPLFAMKILNK